MLQNTWWCVRHGQAENNVKPLVTGRTGGPILLLTEVGKEQAREAAKKDSEWDIIIASPYLRAQQTAEIFAKKRNVQVFTEDRFQEIIMGDIEGKPKQSYSDFVLAHTWTEPFPHGESFEDAGKRALEAVLEWDKKFEGKRILFVSHTGLLRGLLAVIDTDLGSEDLPHAQPFPLPLLKKMRK
jgi:uncharacterized phosphatase